MCIRENFLEGVRGSFPEAVFSGSFQVLKRNTVLRTLHSVCPSVFRSEGHTTTLIFMAQLIFVNLYRQERGKSLYCRNLWAEYHAVYGRSMSSDRVSNNHMEDRTLYVALF